MNNIELLQRIREFLQWNSAQDAEASDCRPEEVPGFSLIAEIDTALSTQNPWVERVAAETERWCKNRMTHHEWCGCSIARKLRGEWGREEGALLRVQGDIPQGPSPDPSTMGQSPGGQGSDATSDPAPRQEETE